LFRSCMEDSNHQCNFTLSILLALCTKIYILSNMHVIQYHENTLHGRLGRIHFLFLQWIVSQKSSVPNSATRLLLSVSMSHTVTHTHTHTHTHTLMLQSSGTRTVPIPQISKTMAMASPIHRGYTPVFHRCLVELFGRYYTAKITSVIVAFFETTTII
jgi:hypothetical protein